MAYHDKDDLDTLWGSRNVAYWADKDRDANAGNIAARKAWAIAATEAMMDEYLENCGYTVPIRDKADAVPTSIMVLATMFTGVLLYTSSGIEHYSFESGKMLHALSAIEHNAKEELLAYKAGTRKIKGAV